MEVVQYILGDFWHFIGFLIILAATFEGIESIVKAIRNK